MRAHAWSWLWCCLVCACVLPEYTLVADSQHKSDAAADSDPSASKEPPAVVLPGAEGDCGRCIEDSCMSERADCGGDCDGLTWPVSPAWNVTDKADPFVRCLASNCEDSCQVRWGCTKRYDWPTESGGYSVTLRVTDAIRGQELEGIRVTACQAIDPACEKDLGRVNSAVTNSVGRAVLAVNDDFFGYFLMEQDAEASAASDEEQFLPMLVDWSEPVYRTEPVLTASMFKASWVTAIASTAEVVESGKGHFIFKAQNCLPERYVNDGSTNASAEGVTASYVALGDGSRVYYTGKGLTLNLQATSTSPEGDSFGGAFNLSPGPVTVTGAHADDDVSTAGFPMRADSIAVVFLLPKSR